MYKLLYLTYITCIQPLKCISIGFLAKSISIYASHAYTGFTVAKLYRTTTSTAKNIYKNLCHIKGINTLDNSQVTFGKAHLPVSLLFQFVQYQKP